MDATIRAIIRDLRNSREALLSIAPGDVVGQDIVAWFEKWALTLKKSDSITERQDWATLFRSRQLWDTEDPEVAGEQRSVIVEKIDNAVVALDANEVVRPVLDELILQTRNQKLSALLLEFNSTREKQPNMAAIGFRTIFNVLVQELAREKQPESDWAKRDDLGNFEESIGYALATSNNLFSSGAKKYIRRYRDSSKDLFDNVAHKSGTLVDKDGLSHAVELLNHLLPELISAQSNER